MKCLLFKSEIMFVIVIVIQLFYYGNSLRNYNRLVLDDIGDDIILTRQFMENDIPNKKENSRMKVNKYSHNGFINPQIIQRNIGVNHSNNYIREVDTFQRRDDMLRFKGVSTKYLRKAINPNIPNDDNIMQEKKNLSNGLILYYGKRTANTKTE